MSADAEERRTDERASGHSVKERNGRGRVSQSLSQSGGWMDGTKGEAAAAATYSCSKGI